jgi:ribosomal protein S18
MTQYDPKNIDKALKRMEDADNLKSIHRSGTNIMSFFDDNDKEHKLQKQQSAAEVQKDEYLKSVELLKTFIQENGTKSDLTRITAFGLLIETTDFFNIPPDRKKMMKENMIWCNKQYEKYVDTTK